LGGFDQQIISVDLFILIQLALVLNFCFKRNNPRQYVCGKKRSNLCYCSAWSPM